MGRKIIINAIDPEECRIAIVKENQLEEFHIESTSREITQGNIYKGIITRVEPALQCVFVDYGAERHGFLEKSEIHPDYFQDTHRADACITKLVRRGQELIVQVLKDPMMKKGALLTTYISLPGRYLILMPGSSTRGISRKIEDDENRDRIKQLVKELSIPEDFGIIIRTAGEDCTKPLLLRDLRYLMRLWESIKQKGMKEDAPALIYKERNLAVRAIRDYFTPDVTGILIDDPTLYEEIKDFMKIISPKHTRVVKLHKDPQPLFSKYQLEDQIASIYENKVELRSGGHLVIEKTEAMVTIDVNSGKAIQKKNIEDTAFQTNLEAAEEIARQLRLRDLGGLIVIDFIDMKSHHHHTEIEKALKQFTKSDKARIKVGKISQFGLLEMSRQRIRPPKEFGTYTPCWTCRGKGVIPSTETLALGFLRKLRLETLKEGITGVRGIVPIEVADYLLNKKRKELLELELRRDITIRIESNPLMIPGESEITYER